MLDPDRIPRQAFINSWDDLANFIHLTAVEKGWWDRERNELELIMLVITELSEAVEAVRHHNPPDDKIPHYTGLEAELADAVIRIMDMGAKLEIDIAGALIDKIVYNLGRDHKHGGKKY